MLGKFRNGIGKRGVALAELVVAMALLAIVSTMIVSFSAMVGDFVESEQSRYSFIEETAVVKERICTWLSQMDEDGTVCSVTGDKLSVSAYGASATLVNHSLVLTDKDGAVSRIELQKISGVQFTFKELSEGNAIVKCTVTGEPFMTEQSSQSFVLTLRCGSFAD